jgi:hypothetical protein
LALGERDNGTAHLQEAVTAYRASLEERTRERVPRDEPAVGPLAWKFLNALSVRRGQPIDDVARAILLSHLDSTSAGRRSAAASALGSFPDGVVLTALERRAATEKNRMVLATLNAHIRTLRRDALSTAKIL